MRIDLHMHTTASDGTFSPSDAVRYAKELGLTAIAITDHDTVAGFDEAEAAGERYGLEVVSGIEISTERKLVSEHLLGYFVDTKSSAMQMMLKRIVRDRDERNLRVTGLMQADGLAVSYDDMQRRFGEVIGRPHFARILMELGLASDTADAFARYLTRGKPYYIKRTVFPFEDSMNTILSAGGLPVLAHPFQYKLDDRQLRELIEYSISIGLRGIECRYSGYTPQQESYLESLAEEYGLLKTGGSDFHGGNKPLIKPGSGKGELCVPYAFLRELKLAAGRM